MNARRFSTVAIALTILLQAAPAPALISKANIAGPGGGVISLPPADPTVPPPAVPRIHRKTTTSITIAWTDNSTVEDGYRVWRYESGKAPILLRELGRQTHNGAVQYPDRLLRPGIRYCYRVQAFNAHGVPNIAPEVCTVTNEYLSLEAIDPGRPPAAPASVPCASVRSGFLRGVLVDDRPGLTGELEARWEGRKLICVADHAVIDLTGEAGLPLQAGLTLASGRHALTPGALLYTNSFKTRPLLRVRGDGVRVTGLRIRGPEPGIGTGDDRPTGILTTANRGIEIDHNELYGWSGAAIAVNDIDRNEGGVRTHGVINGANAAEVHIHHFDARDK